MVIQLLTKEVNKLIFLKRLWIRAIRFNTWTLVFATTSLVLFSSIFMKHVEPEAFPSTFDGLWWTMTTLATVGYGDIYPTTIIGKIFAMLLYVVGIGIMTLLIGKVIDFLIMRKRLREEGKLQIKDSKHIILVGWSKKAQITLQEILEASEEMIIVIIDETLEKTPILHERVKFVKGDPASEHCLLQANVLECSKVFIFSPESAASSREADGSTVLTALSIEGIGSKHKTNIYTICEIQDAKHVQSFRNANVEEFITPNDTAGHLAARTILFSGASEVIRQLTSNKGYDLYIMDKKPVWGTYADAKAYLSSHGATLLSDGTDFSIMKRLDDVIPEEAKLFIVCDEDTYKNIHSK